MIFLIPVVSTQAQKTFNDSIAESRNRLTKNAMIVLGGWAVANIASGFIVANNTNGEAKYVWRMNAYWNFINLGLAGLGYIGTRKLMSRKYEYADNLEAQQNIEKLYVFNAGLDLAYIAGGFYLRERGNRETDPDKINQFKGYGTSIIIQGGFLLMMDCVMYTLHHRNTRRMNNKIKQIEINAGPGGLGMIYHF
jgi:hypothetical protein